MPDPHLTLITLTTAIILWICLVALAAGFTQGLTGFGFAVICTPLLSMFVPVKICIIVSTICGGAGTLPILATHWRHILWRPVLMLTLSAAPGLWLGAKMLKHVPVAWIIGFLGAVLIAIAIFQLRNGRLPPAWRGRTLAIVCGFLSGAVGSVTAAPGPPIIAYTSVQIDWDVRETKAVMNAFFLLQTFVVLPIYAAHDLLTRDVARVCAWAAPLAACGLAGGLLLSHALRNRLPLMRRIIYTAVLLLGFSMLAKALWH